MDTKDSKRTTRFIKGLQIMEKVKFHIYFRCNWLKLFGRKTLIFRNWAFINMTPQQAWNEGTGRYLAGLYSYVTEYSWSEYYQHVSPSNEVFAKIPKDDYTMWNVWYQLVANGYLIKKPIYNINEEEVAVTVSFKEEEK